MINEISYIYNYKNGKTYINFLLIKINKIITLCNSMGKIIENLGFILNNQ